MDEVTYQDNTGKSYTHYVHEEQLPLPKVVSKGLTDDQIKILDYQDYYIETDPHRIEQEIQQNTAIAETCLTSGENLTWDLSTLYEVFDKSGTRKIFTYYGLATIDFQTEQNYGIATSQGFRDAMEDTHLTDRINSHYLSVIFDGHGGIHCAEHAKKAFPTYFKKWLNKLSFPDEETNIYNAINLAFIETNRTFPGYNSGSTANLCLVHNDDLWIANLGDSRALFVTPNEIIQLSEDQKPIMPQHREFIEGRGAMISDWGTIIHDTSPYSIAPGRSLGDHHLKGGMFARPVITRIKLPKEGYLVQACDGVFDVASSKQIGELVQHQYSKTSAQIAYLIAATAYANLSRDNITVLVTPVQTLLRNN